MESSLVFRTKDYNRKVTEEVFDYYRCLSCGIVFLNPVPSDLGKYYPSGYHLPPSTRGDMEKMASRERYKIDIVKEQISGGRLLEIGPSWGAFCHLAKNAGFDIDAIEMDPACCLFLTDIVKVKAHHGNEILPILDRIEPYDVAALWHVVEHLPNPLNILRTVSDKLKPGGILIVAAPNPDSWQFKVQKKRWHHLDAPRHVQLIPPHTLLRQIERFNMRTVYITTRDPGSLRLNITGWQFLLANLSGNALVRKALHTLGTLLGMSLSSFERAEGCGSAYTALFRKEVLK
ncbi:MAG: class I SAM-dependent methyltransferase [Clostridiales bacterium]|nr:class I SAM-dependent methyltransferase [Clostridiales bacterium]